MIEDSDRASRETDRSNGQTREGPDGSAGGSAAEAVAEEAGRYHRLQRAVQVSLALIYQTEGLTLGEAIEIALAAKSIALDLFPGSGETFDMIYRPRLMRAISERFGIEDAPEAL